MNNEYYNTTIEEILKEFDSNTKTGLTQVQVQEKIKKYGLNKLDTKTSVNPFKIFIEQFHSFIVYILLFAVIISLTFEHYIDATIILIILIANSIIGFMQEYSAQKSLEALKKLDLTKASVYRNSKLIEIDSSQLVLGDIIFLEAGDKIPADARIFEERKLKVNESALTGESLSVSKHSEIITKQVQIGDQKNMLFSASTISEGSAKAIVVKTAMATEIGKITTLIKEAKEEQTPLQKKLERFGKNLSYIIIAICILIFLILIMTKGFSTENLLLFALIAISLAVAAVPTALPAVVTVALSIGVKNLLKKKALVRKLSSVETLGSCDVICTDKTGTLTKNEMTVQKAWTLDNEAEIYGIGYNPHGEHSQKLNPLLFKIGSSCNNSSVYKKNNLWEISGDPTEAALKVSFQKTKEKDDSERIDELPFDSERKMMSVLVKEKNELLVYTKGSTQALINKCTHTIINNKTVKLTEDLKQKINLKNDEYSRQALRVLCFAYKQVSSQKDFSEDKLIFVGLQAMIDPPRPDVITSIQKTKDAGIRVIMITGDYKETAKAIGKQIGIEGEVITGEELTSMTDTQLETALNNNTNIFARVIPEHKQRIVTILQKQGHVVAMTGDGVNDAPALKKADIGIAVGSGTDVAKEAADLVLLDDSFSNIVNTIEEGRGIYDNIQKSIMLLLSGNLGEVLIIFLAIITGFNLPLTAILLLWINLVTDGGPALAFAVDPYNKNIMKRKPIKSTEGILPKYKLMLITILGVVSTIIGLWIFTIYEATNNLIYAQTMIFNFIVLYECLLVFIIRKEYNIKQLSNIWLYFAIMLSVFFQAIVMYTPLKEIFKIVAIDLIDISILLFGGLVFVLIYTLYQHLINTKMIVYN